MARESGDFFAGLDLGLFWTPLAFTEKAAAEMATSKEVLTGVLAMGR